MRCFCELVSKAWKQWPFSVVGLQHLRVTSRYIPQKWWVHFTGWEHRSSPRLVRRVKKRQQRVEPKGQFSQWMQTNWERVTFIGSGLNLHILFIKYMVSENSREVSKQLRMEKFQAVPQNSLRIECLCDKISNRVQCYEHEVINIEKEYSM